jgi:hypothetical protein
VGDRLDWPHGELESLTRAALSMNLALGPLQDRLVQQREGLSADQQRQLAGHGDRAARPAAAPGRARRPLADGGAPCTTTPRRGRWPAVRWANAWRAC